MKNLPFFKFDAESWLTGRIQVLPVDEIGVYINLAARIWKAGGALKNDRFLPRLLGASKELFDAAMEDFRELEIIEETEDGMLRIKFLDAQLEDRAAFLRACSAGGRNRKQPSSDLQGTSSNHQVTQKAPASNKKEDIREKKEEKEGGSNPPPQDHEIAENVLGKELAGDFQRWLEVWAVTHNNGREMPFYRQQAQLRMLHGLPVEIRKEAIECAIRGGWRAIHDIRQPRQGERPIAATARKTGVITETPQYSKNERGKR